MSYLSDGSHLKPHFPPFDVFVVDVVLMHRNSLISAFSNQISQRCIETAIEMCCCIIYDLNLQKTIVQVINEMDEIHLVIVNTIIHGDLNMHYFGNLLFKRLGHFINSEKPYLTCIFIDRQQLRSDGWFVPKLCL